MRLTQLLRIQAIDIWTLVPAVSTSTPILDRPDRHGAFLARLAELSRGTTKTMDQG